jgi:hypothetical protein
MLTTKHMLNLHVFGGLSISSSFEILKYVCFIPLNAISLNDLFTIEAVWFYCCCVWLIIDSVTPNLLPLLTNVIDYAQTHSGEKPVAQFFREVQPCNPPLHEGDQNNVHCALI